MKILILAGSGRSLVNFRGPLIEALVREGHEVVAAAPLEAGFGPAQAAALGARFEPLQFARAGLNPLSDFLSMRRMDALFRRERPDILLASTIKPVVYGTVSARKAGVPRIFALVTGLGAAFHSSGWRGRALAFVAARLYRRALRRCTGVMVQNRDIAEHFRRRGIAAESLRLIVVAGSGVDLVHFAARPFPSGAEPCFLLLGRLLKDKGICEYVEAAREVRREFPAAQFLLAGDFDPNPAAISREQLEDWKKEGVIEYHPFAPDVRPLLERCSVFVLPSYHEGMPRSVLEAMATGRGIVTTYTIGCRDTVFGVDPVRKNSSLFQTGENGLLVPVRSSGALAAAMKHLARHPATAAAMGQRGRELAEQCFDVRKVNAMMLDFMGLKTETDRAARNAPNRPVTPEMT